MKFVFLTLVLLVSASALGQDDFSSEFLIGKYLLVGKGFDSNETYIGKVEIYREEGNLKIKRVVNNQVIVGETAIESALGGDTKVLRFRYKEAGEMHEQTCLWQSDLDNYARISCYLYQPNVKTLNPGLEVLFHDHTAN